MGEASRENKTKVLVADDDPVALHLFSTHLSRWGFEVVTAEDGTEAERMIRADEGIRLAILDWMMPGVDGVDLCRRLRSEEPGRPLYLVICTARGDTADVVQALESGANDYVTKPITKDELRARLLVGERTVELESALHGRIADLREALAHVKQLQGLLPICMHCKRIRTGDDAWQRIERYLEKHAEVEFSHGVCDRCLEEHYAGVGED